MGVPFLFILFLFLLSFNGIRFEEAEHGFVQYNLQTNTARTNVDLMTVLSGGPGKDGIPALNSPQFTSVAESKENDAFRGILFEKNGERRFYPYSILVWHEIVNDSIGDTYFAVTFCPLCGTGIVYDRTVGGTILEFRVSGLLRESNLLMYDATTESLWSQSLGEAVVGDRLGDTLEVLSFQLIPFGELREKYPNAKVLSRETGFVRSYGVYPYGDYEKNENILFPVSFADKRFPAKKLMYVIPFENSYYATPYDGIPEGETIFAGRDISFDILRDENEITVTKETRDVPGYFEMWFSFITHHQDDGIILHKLITDDE